MHRLRASACFLGQCYPVAHICLTVALRTVIGTLVAASIAFATALAASLLQPNQALVVA